MYLLLLSLYIYLYKTCSHIDERLSSMRHNYSLLKFIFLHAYVLLLLVDEHIHEQLWSVEQSRQKADAVVHVGCNQSSSSLSVTTIDLIRSDFERQQETSFTRSISAAQLVSRQFTGGCLFLLFVPSISTLVRLECCLFKLH